MSFAAECRKKIADLNVHAMGDNAEWDVHGREVFDLVHRMADEIERLSVPAECTDDMAHAMSRLDGYDRDRDMPSLQRWKDYWDAAMAEASRLRWIACPACGGSGEIIRRAPNARDPSDEFSEICGVCEGTGRDVLGDPPGCYDSSPSDPHHGGKIWKG